MIFEWCKKVSMGNIATANKIFRVFAGIITILIVLFVVMASFTFLFFAIMPSVLIILAIWSRVKSILNSKLFCINNSRD